MSIREATMYQAVCDECGGTAYDMDRLWEAAT